MRKALFIGLGGTGTMTVAHIKANLKNYYNSMNRPITEFEADNCFLCIDTDSGTYDKIENIESLKGILDKENDFISLATEAPLAVYNASKQKVGETVQIDDWAVKPETWPYSPLAEGAKADRQIGRSALVNKSDYIFSALTGKLKHIRDARFAQENITTEDATKAANDVAPFIWVYSSGTGGTGSSLLTDMLIFIDKVYRTNFAGTDAYLKLFLFMARPFLEKNPKNLLMPLNSHAVYVELNQFYQGFLSGSSLGVQSLSVIDIYGRLDVMGVRDMNVSPFKYIIPIDSHFGNKSYKIDELPQITANISTHLHVGIAGSAQASDFDNELHNITTQGTLQTRLDDKMNWFPFLVPVGYRTIQKPNQELKDYVVNRLQYEVLNGLLGTDIQKTHENPEDRQKAIDEFVNDSIYRFIKNGNKIPEVINLENDLRNKVYEVIGIESDTYTFGLETGVQEDWVAIKPTINSTISNLSTQWKDDNSFLAKSKYKAAIMQAVRQKTEENILKYGFEYALDLITLADDKVCEKYKKECEINREKFESKKLTDIEDLILKFKKKDRAPYQQSVREYVDLSIDKYVNEFIIELLHDLTKQTEGLLEIFRSNTNGLGKIKTRILTVHEEAIDSYKALAKKFTETQGDVSKEYFPTIAGMPAELQIWKSDNKFAELYNESVIIRDPSKGINNMGDFISLRRRDGEEKSIEFVLKLLKEKMIPAGSKESLYFCKNWLKDYMVSFNADKVVDDFMKNLTYDFIDRQLLSPDCSIKTWLGDSLETLLGNDQTIIRRISENFSTGTKLMFETNVTKEGVTERAIYVSKSVPLANKFGYDPNRHENLHVPNNDEYSLTKIRMVPGYTFSEYSGYLQCQNPYNDEKKNKFQTYFPHIHKELKDNTILELGIRQGMKTFMSLFLFESMKQAFKTKFPSEYSIIFGNSTSSSGGGFQTFSKTNSDENVIKLTILDINNAKLEYVKDVDVIGGQYRFSNILPINVSDITSSANKLFTEVLKKYGQLNDTRKALFDNFKSIDYSSKSILKSFIETEFNLSIAVKLNEILAKPIIDNRFASDKVDMDFMNNMFIVGANLKAEFIKKLN